MLLKKIIKNLTKEEEKIKIKGLSINSKKVKKGFIFFAIKGKKFNGEKFISEAVKNFGSSTIISYIETKQIKENKYDNIKTYTYGIKRSHEIYAAKEIAKKMKVDWEYIEFNPSQIRKIFHCNDRKEYFKYASGLNSTPNLSGYFAHYLLNS